MLVLKVVGVIGVTGDAGGEYDVVVYGATPAGIAATLSAASVSPSLKVLLLEPTRYVGGMAGPGGIGLRDIGNTAVINSTAKEWGMLNAAHYGVSYPVWQPDHYVGNESFWKQLQSYENLDVVLNARVVEGSGVEMSGTTITALTTSSPSAGVWKGKYFVDASYEGDVVIASKKISYTWGRESMAKYNESLAGITGGSVNQFKYPINATWANGTLLRWVQDLPDPRTREGEADGNLMAFSYRLCLTPNEKNRVPFSAPPGYRTEDFELNRRYIQQLVEHKDDVALPWGNLIYRSYPPGDKFDACCGMNPIGIDSVGLGVGYPNGSYADQARIAAEIQYYVMGLAWFWTGDENSGVPQSVRESLSKYGLCKDEWPENNHIPPQLYVREGIRIVGDHVFTQQDRIPADQPGGCKPTSIGSGAWGFDIHEMQRCPVQHLDESGTETSAVVAFNEGLTNPGTGGNPVFDLPLSLVLPKRTECTNLAVPNCPSISHVAFAAVREEPTLWQLGQGSGTAAALQALQSSQPPLQDVDITALQSSLLQQGVIIHYPPRPNCSAPIPTPCSTYTVAGAGSTSLNGKYTQASISRNGHPVWQLGSSTNQIYWYESHWHLADYGSTLWYYNEDGAAEGPPSNGWIVANGTAPPPTITCNKVE